MIRPPFAARVAAGIAVSAVEGAMKLPSTAATMPMTAVSQVLQTTMRVQQTMTALAIKGDQAFEMLHWTQETDQPEWAVFDEDLSADAPDSGAPDSGAADSGATVEPKPAATDTAEGEKADKSRGHFALYSLSPEETPPLVDEASSSVSAVEVPEIVSYLDYESLTLAQLRSRLKSLTAQELTTLLEFEDATLARAPFQTMIANRITTATAK